MQTINIKKIFKHDGDLLALAEDGKVYFWDYNYVNDEKVYGWKLSYKYLNRVLK